MKPAMPTATDYLLMSSFRAGELETHRPYSSRSAPGFGPEDDPQGHRLAALVRVSAQILWVAQPNGEIAADSPSWREFTGQSTSQFLGFGWLDAIHPEDRTPTLIAWQAALDSRTRYEAVYRLRYRGEAWRWTRARGCPVLDANDQVECWVGLNDDITVQRNAEVALAASELHFKSIAETVPDFIWIADERGRVNYWNPAWYAATGLKPSQSMGLDAAQAIRPDLREQILGRWKSAVEAAVAFETEIPLRGVDGDYQWYIARAKPIREINGSVVRWCGVMANIDLQKQTAEELRSERALREQFVSGLVHDLRNVCGSGHCAHKHLVSGDCDQMERSEYESLVTQSFERVARMIADLLDANQISSGRSLPIKTPSEFNLARCVLDTIHAMGSRFHRNVRVLVDPNFQVYWSRADFVRVVENLVTNAEKYGSKDSPITIAASVSDSCVDWSVHNLGPAIAIEARHSLFDFLKRVDDERTRRAPGWGIGLTLVKGIVEAHGGTISVESDDQLGTTFSMRMPIVVPIR